MYTSGKKEQVQQKRWKPENKSLKSGIQPLMESGIHSVESGIQDSLGLPYMGRDSDMKVHTLHYAN